MDGCCCTFARIGFFVKEKWEWSFVEFEFDVRSDVGLFIIYFCLRKENTISYDTKEIYKYFETKTK